MIEEFKKYINGHTSLIYEDINIITGGINYLKPIFINKTYLLNNIINFQDEQLRLIFYIYLRGYKNKYLHTNFDTVLMDLNITKYLLIKTIDILQENQYINIFDNDFKIIDKKLINTNQVINIELNINNFLTNKVLKHYIYLPFDYINKAINELTGKEFVLLLKLILINHYYNYYTKDYEDLNFCTKKDFLKHKIFSYTTLKEEAKNIKISANNINNLFITLRDKKYINIGKLNKCYFYNDDNIIKLLNTSYIYQVILYTKIEYIYYYSLLYKNIISDELEYLRLYYKKYLIKYKEILLTNNTDDYKEFIIDFKHMHEYTSLHFNENNLIKKELNHKTGRTISAKLRIKLLNKSARWVESEKKYVPACQFCGKTALETTLHIDHIVPYSKGGETIESNLQVLCEECNEQKNNKYKLIINEDIENN